jgi:flagellar motor switch/type III secretory pathway protein FliN
MQYTLGFLTKKQKEQLFNKINDPIYNWCQDWINLENRPTIRLKDFSDYYRDLILNNGVVALGGIKSLFFLIKSQNEWLKIFFKGIENELPLDNIANFLIGRAKADLVGKITGNITDADSIKERATLEFIGVPIIIEINLGIRNIELILDSNIFESSTEIESSTANTSLNLVAISDEITSLSVSFALEKISMTDFLDLQVGDVIKSKHSIVEPFEISCGNKEIAMGSLGQLENQLAILLKVKEENIQ